MNINKLKRLISEEAMKQTHKKVLTESSKILPDSFVNDKEQEEPEDKEEKTEEVSDADKQLTQQMKVLLDDPAFVAALRQKLGL
jgi:predicted component of type VI protein secretion system